jgi:MFS family permease
MPEPSDPQQPPISENYARYALGVLVLVYVFNFLDRQILSILAEDIKADLGLGDAEIGFLYGTAFAVFYAIFGIPLGRLADAWTRRTVISLGMALWSLMTAASGFATSFRYLAVARIGVGIGEASASPSAFSLLSDYFPPERRATVMAIYSSGLYVGAGIGLFLGGWIVDSWNGAWPTGNAPLGLKGWQAAFMIVGLPGLLMALWVRTLREPPRSGEAESDGSKAEDPWGVFRSELAMVMPGFTLVTLSRAGAGSRGIMVNLAAAAGLVATAAGLTSQLGDAIQWYALAIGIYATFSWVQNLALTDPSTFEMIFRGRTLRSAVVGFSLMAFSSYSVGFWVVPYFLRTFDLSVSEVGTSLGLISAVGGWLGATVGGFTADAWRKRARLGRLNFCVVSAVLPMPFVALLVRTDQLAVAYAMAFLAQVSSGIWLGAAISTVQDLVAPRMRAVAGAIYILMMTFVGLALGPYSIGKASEVTGDLGFAIQLALIANALAIPFFLTARRHLVADEDRVTAALEV